MTFTNADTSITIPSGAGPNDPQIFLGDQIPAELTTFYNDAFRSIVAVQLFRLDSKAYAYEAIVVYNNGNAPYRAAGVVNLDRTDFKVMEFTAYYLADTTQGVMYVGGYSVGGTGSPESQALKVIVNRPAEFEYNVTFWGNLFDCNAAINANSGISTYPGGLAGSDVPRVIGAAGQPAFQNSFGNYGAGYTPPRFWSDAEGKVHADGLVSVGVAPVTGQVIFSTSGISGYQPKTRKIFNQRVDGGGKTSTRIDVTTNGDFVIAEAATAPGVGGAISLEGIVFRTDY